MGINLFKKKNAAAPVADEKKPAPMAPAKSDTAVGDKPADPAAPAAPVAPEEKKVLENDDSTEVDVNGTRVPLHELISDYVEKQGGEPASEEIDPATMVALPDGTQVSIADLIASYGGGEAGAPAPAMTNSADADADDPAGKDSDPAKVKANAAPAKRTVNKALQNAATNSGAIAADMPMTKTERAALGRKMYGLGKKGGEA